MTVQGVCTSVGPINLKQFINICILGVLNFMSNMYPTDAAAADADGEQTSVAQPVHSASTEAGSWSCSRVLLSNLRGK